MNTHPPDNANTAVTQTAPLMIARQAVLDQHRAVFGYELFDRSVAPHRHTAASDAQLLFNALSAADSEFLSGKKTIFINCTHDTLAGGHLDLVTPDNVVLEIPPLGVTELEQIQTRLVRLQEITKRGFRLAFDYSALTRSYETWLPLASFIKIDLAVVKPSTLASYVNLAQARSSAQLIAEKVETAEQYEAACALGIRLFQGYWFSKPVLIQGQKIRPAQAAILHLINLVRQQASTHEIEEVFKRNPSLSFNLLKFINSASFGMRTEVTSFKHAVMLLGLNRLFKWAALLMTTSQPGDALPAVGTTAVVRGRLMELLAAETLAAEDSDHAFVVGVFSLLDTMLGVPMQAALSALNLPDNVSAALLENTGPLAAYLRLAVACETGDDATFAEAAATLNLSSKQINGAHLDALAWAEALT
ncbi:EAL and HDOD domain-containing protein [Rhodoferax aquaticus]|uniref:HDOD domain-containing protein n=1 Tax=Rhodoferax aquaticus TaxID=2527691 RepID=A0A515EML6_9BURK|nr:HDOD domain-containing protein [Rhodoferax aquaticus]QDL53898.1 HDOD domain-containing protein [Rhodoferax aquaticus]